MDQGQAAAGALGLSLSPLDALASQTRTVKLNIERNPQGQAEQEDDYFSRATTSSSGGHEDRRPTPLDLGPMPSSYETPAWSPPRTNVTREDDETSFLDMGSSPPKAVEPAPRSPLGLSGQFRSTKRHHHDRDEQHQHRRGPSGSSNRSRMTFETDSTDYVWQANDDEHERRTENAGPSTAGPPKPGDPELAPPGLTRKASTGHAPRRQTRSARPDTVVRSMIALEEDNLDEVLASPHPVKSGPLLSPASAMFPRAGAGRETSWTSAGSTGQTDSAYLESDGRGYASGISGMSDPFEYTVRVSVQ